jgi:hypothetical protein
MISGLIKYAKAEMIPHITDKAFAIVMATGVSMIENKPDIIGNILKNEMVSTFVEEKDGMYNVDSLKKSLTDTITQYGDLKIKIPGIKFISPEEKEFSFSSQDINKIYEYMTGAR